MNFMVKCVKCNREFDASATNADHIRSLCCLCNDQHDVVGDDGGSEDSDDVSGESDSDTENVAAQDNANDLVVPEPPRATIPIEVVPDVGVKSGEEIGHLLLTAMKSLQPFFIKIGSLGMLEFNQARHFMLFSFKIKLF
jgi:hypothetical protein